MTSSLRMAILLGACLLLAYLLYKTYRLFLWLNPGLRTSQTLRVFDAYRGAMKVVPLECPNNYRVCDYFVSAANKPVFSSPTVFDYTSGAAVLKTLGLGCRVLELTLFEEGGRPVVGSINSTMRFRQSLNPLPLEDVLAPLKSLDTSLPNTNDPLFLSLYLPDPSTSLVNNVADILKTNLREKLLDSSYSWQKKNIAQEPICNLSGKVVVVSGGGIRDTDLDELVNLSWDGPHLRRLRWTDAEATHDASELTDYNRQNLTLVVPEPSTTNRNRSADVCHSYGCQWVLMNWMSLDAAMLAYAEQFQQSAFVLKPDGLRFQRPTYPDPVQPHPNLSYQPVQVITPIYNMQI